MCDGEVGGISTELGGYAIAVSPANTTHLGFYSKEDRRLHDIVRRRVDPRFGPHKPPLTSTLVHSNSHLIGVSGNFARTLTATPFLHLGIQTLQPRLSVLSLHSTCGLPAVVLGSRLVILGGRLYSTSGGPLNLLRRFRQNLCAIRTAICQTLKFKSHPARCDTYRNDRKTSVS
jgi:hypothetical protein